MGRSSVGCIMVTERFQKGCGKVICRCVMVAGRSPIGCVLVVGRSFHNVISQRHRTVIGSLHNDVVATSLHDVIMIKTGRRDNVITTSFCLLGM